MLDADLALSFFAPVEPRPQPRPRFDPRSRRVISGTSRSGVRAYKRALATVARVAMIEAGIREPLEGPLRVDLVCTMPRPLAHYVARKRERPLRDDAPVWHVAKPDRDNLDKSVLDALNGVAWGDDSQVCAGELVKRYPREGERVGVSVRISRLA